MYYSRMYIHIMWTTDNCQHSLLNHAKKMGTFLIGQAERKGINCMIASVLSNHVHCLVKLNSTQSVSDIVQILKGSSSLWMNNNNVLPYKFKWEDEYFAFTIGHSKLKEFEKYLFNQSVFHKTISLKQEIALIDKKYNLKYK